VTFAFLQELQFRESLHQTSHKPCLAFLFLIASLRKSRLSRFGVTGGEQKPFPAYCVLLSVADKLVMLKLLIKVGVSALALMLAALPVAACVLPGAAMTSAERECCKKMAEQCGDMGMAKTHPCCKVSATPADFHALKTASSQLDHVSLVLFHALPLTAQADVYFSLAQWSSRVSCTHSPPGLESLTTTILRI